MNSRLNFSQNSSPGCISIIHNEFCITVPSIQSAKFHPFLNCSLTEQVWAVGLAEGQSVSSQSPGVGRTCRLGRTEQGAQSWWAAHQEWPSDGYKDNKQKTAQLV